MMSEIEIVKDETGESYRKDGKPVAIVSKVLLPVGEGDTLQELGDIDIWLRFNVLLQGVDELTKERGEAGDATRQLRIVAQECVRRKMFERRVTLSDEVTDEHLWTWYTVLKQMVEGENLGKWEKVGDANREYTIVVKELLARGHTMPAQKIDLEALNVFGELVKPQVKAK